MHILIKWKLWLVAVVILATTLTNMAYFTRVSQMPERIVSWLGQRAANIDLTTMVAQAFPWGGSGWAGGKVPPPLSPLPKPPKPGGPPSPLSPLPTPNGMAFPPVPGNGGPDGAP